MPHGSAALRKSGCRRRPACTRLCAYPAARHNGPHHAPQDPSITRTRPLRQPVCPRLPAARGPAKPSRLAGSGAGI